MLRRVAQALLPRNLQDELRLRRAIKGIEERLRRERPKVTPRSHGLSQAVYVSLTSYPPRFRTLHLTLETLLRQSVRPDGILLWIARQDLRKLPRKVKALARRGIDIRACDDLRSYKKLVFALGAYPDSILVTADDDVSYPIDWLETLVAGIVSEEPVVVCHRAHRLIVNGNGDIAPYADWQFDVQDEAARRPSSDLVPVGVGGILYPPGCLSDEATQRATFMELSPTADDLWFYWMARRAGTRHKKVGGKFAREHWPQSQANRLFDQNGAGGNDAQIRALQSAFGSPYTHRHKG